MMTKGRKRRHESGTPQKEGAEGPTLEDAIEELKVFIGAKTGEAVDEIRRVFDQKLTVIEESLNFAYASIVESSKKINKLEIEMKNMNVEKMTSKIGWQGLSSRTRRPKEHERGQC